MVEPMQFYCRALRFKGDIAQFLDKTIDKLRDICVELLDKQNTFLGNVYIIDDINSNFFLWAEVFSLGGYFFDMPPMIVPAMCLLYRR